MKRAGNLYQKIANYENLCLAFWKARKGKDAKAEVQRFRESMHEEISALRNGLLSGSVMVGEYHYFEIFEPKKRQICAAAFRERVLHHAIINICGPYFERFLIFDTYACRKGKGTHKAVERAQFYSPRGTWYMKLDIAQYFHSIDHGILMKLLERMFKDKQLLDLFKKIIASYHIIPGKGVPIGNLTSQYFANYYLGFLDYFIKQKLRMKQYVKYMDDFVLWSNSKQELRDCLREITKFLSESLSLIVRDVMSINYTSNGMNFLGYRIFPHDILLARRSRSRFIKKYCNYERKYVSGIWSEDVLARHVETLVAFTRHAAATSFRKNVIHRYGAVS